jgi:hypothetical protein
LATCRTVLLAVLLHVVGHDDQSNRESNTLHGM